MRATDSSAPSVVVSHRQILRSSPRKDCVTRDSIRRHCAHRRAPRCSPVATIMWLEPASLPNSRPVTMATPQSFRRAPELFLRSSSRMVTPQHGSERTTIRRHGKRAKSVRSITGRVVLDSITSTDSIPGTRASSSRFSSKTATGCRARLIRIITCQRTWRIMRSPGCSGRKRSIPRGLSSSMSPPAPRIPRTWRPRNGSTNTKDSSTWGGTVIAK